MAKSTFVDINKEKYLKALFRDVQKQSKLVDFEKESANAKIIYEFVIGNPTNSDTLNKRNGLFIIKPRLNYK